MSKHPQGNLRELVVIAFPLMFSIFSSSAMVVVDRMFLSRWDLEILSGVVAVSIFTYGIACSIFGITTMAGVFAGRFNGAKKYFMVSVPMWQMIYFSLAVSVITIPVGLTCYDIFFIDELGNVEIYFNFLVSTSFLLPLFSAFQSFFSAIGRTKILVKAVLIGNIVNILLDPILIFGFPGCLVEFGFGCSGNEVIEPMGVKGAAIGTVFAQIISILILFFCVIGKELNAKYHTRKMSKLNYKYLKKCIKFGLPNSIWQGIEIMVWFIILTLFAGYSEMHSKIFAIASLMFNLFDCIGFGVKGAVSAIVANYMGANRKYLLGNILRTATKYLSIFCTAILILLLVFSGELVKILTLGEVTEVSYPELHTQASIALLFVFIYIYMDSLNSILGGTLTAGGDTKFLMVVNLGLLLLFALCTTLTAVNYFQFPAYASILWQYPYQFILMIVLYFRYRGDRWIKV